MKPDQKTFYQHCYNLQELFGSEVWLVELRVAALTQISPKEGKKERKGGRKAKEV
jgi:hypothetical protein